MSVASIQIYAIGKMDAYLSGPPGDNLVTFWKATYKKHTRFAIESIRQPFNTTTTWGQESQMMLNRVGDMVYWMYLTIDLPGIVACDTKTEPCPGIVPGGQFPVYMDGGNACLGCAQTDEAALLEYLPPNYADLSDDEKQRARTAAADAWRRQHYGSGTGLGCCSMDDSYDCPDTDCPELNGVWCHWVNDVGHFAIETVDLCIGGNKIDTLWGLFMFLWEELTGKSGRRLTEMTGRRYTRMQLICDSRGARRLYIPTPFWFTLASGHALPLCALAYHGVQLKVTWASLSKLIVVSDSSVQVRNAGTGLGLTPADLTAHAEISYVFLDEPERRKFQEGEFRQLIVQTQRYYRPSSTSLMRTTLNFNHPTLELIWCVRRACQERVNNWTNLSGIEGRDPIVDAELHLNMASRFGKKSAMYHRTVVPYQFHTNIPDTFTYVMSFALSPENSVAPSGTMNLSRIDATELVLNMQPGMENESVSVYVFSRSFNILKFGEGLGGLAFA